VIVRIAVLALTLLFALVRSPGGAADLPKVVVTWGGADVAFAPVWITYKAGLFKKHGLDVDLVYQASTLQIPSLLSGDVQIIHLGGPELVSAAAAGADVVVLATIAPVYAYMLMAPNAVRKPSDLKGASIGISKFGDTSDIETKDALRRYGVDPKDVTIVQIGSSSNRTTALLSGAVRATLLSPPITNQIAPQGYHVLIDLAKLRIPAALTVSARRSWVNAHRDVVQRYIDALCEGIALEKRDKAYAISVISEYLKIDDQQLVAATYDFYAKEVLPSVPYVRVEQLKSGLSELVKTNPNLNNVDVSTLMDNSYLQNAAKKLKK
jgi:NitT/TauT family transport system substrate-binding protein